MLNTAKLVPTETTYNPLDAVEFGANHISIDDIVQIAHGQRYVKLSTDNSFINKIRSGVEFLDKLLKEDGVIYGVTTGYGDSCHIKVAAHLTEELPLHLTRFHGCGLGNILSPELSTATVAARLASLCQGFSGVRLKLLEQLVLLINSGISPVIPEEGSVGASGDLTPLSYVAAALIGEREVYYKKERRQTADVFSELEIEPLTLRPKEGLAIMNGTAMMTALACIAYSRAEYLTKLVSRLTSMSVIALNGNSYHFDEILFSVKHHPGQNKIAEWIRHDLQHVEHPRNPDCLQDRYSLRCAPHIIGVLKDALPWMKQNIETELNSSNDNPIIDGIGGHVLHGGHFYGGHICFVMDCMKTAVANLADLMDRQLALMMDTKYNRGLPANLSGALPPRSTINHGFKAVQIGASAWTAEALKLTMPASVFSRSTECHNQDKVSMGTIAARDCLRVIELTEQVAAASLLSVCQALRLRSNEKSEDAINENIMAMRQNVAKYSPHLCEDRPLEAELRTSVNYIQNKQWSLYV